MNYDNGQTRHRPVAGVCADVTRRGSEHPRGGIMTVCHWCQQPDPDVEWRGEPYHYKCVATVKDSRYE